MWELNRISFRWRILILGRRLSQIYGPSIELKIPILFRDLELCELRRVMLTLVSFMPVLTANLEGMNF